MVLVGVEAGSVVEPSGGAAPPMDARCRSSSALRAFSSSFFRAFHSLRISLNSIDKSVSAS